MPTFMDLFAGAGGMTAGFVRGGFQPVFAVEADPDAAQTHRANFGEHVYAGPIETIPVELFPRVDVLIGGPPCQGFSPLGRMTGGQSNRHLNVLIDEYARVVEAVLPEVFVVENVPHFLRSAEFAKFAERMHPNYVVRAAVLDASDFGVAQRRRRAVVIGSRLGTLDPAQIPRTGRRTVGEAIGHLMPPEPPANDITRGQLFAGSMLHFPRNPTPVSVERYRQVPPGGNRFDLSRSRPDITPRCWLDKASGSTDVFGRLEWGDMALTIRTEFFKPEKGRYLHPSEHRAITHLEASLLQGFDETFLWFGTKTSIARQIGNAVPPPFAEAIAKAVSAHMVCADRPGLAVATDQRTTAAHRADG